MTRIFISLVAAVFSITSFAQSAVNAPEAKVEEAKNLGWTFKVELGATTNWGYDKNFVGVIDGHYWSLGGKAIGHANYLEGAHEWQNRLSLLETFNKTPVLDAFLKGADQLSLESLYQWSFGGWWGAFAQLNADTSIFASDDVRAAPLTYSTTSITGAVTTQTASTLRLTDPFLPFSLRESLGLFAKPVDMNPLTWEIKVGGNARQTFADGQKIVSGQTGSTVNVATLASFYQLGILASTSIHGELMPKRISYKAGVEASYAAYQSSAKPLPSDFASRVNLETMAQVSFHLVDWAALTWDFKGLRLPALTSDFQIQTNLLLTFSYTL